MIQPTKGCRKLIFCDDYDDVDDVGDVEERVINAVSANIGGCQSWPPAIGSPRRWLLDPRECGAVESPGGCHQGTRECDERIPVG